MGAREPIPRESTKDTVKTVARGRPGLSGCTCGTCRLHSFEQAGHGPQPRSGLPRALSLFRRGMIAASPGPHGRREGGVVSYGMSRAQCDGRRQPQPQPSSRPCAGTHNPRNLCEARWWIDFASPPWPVAMGPCVWKVCHDDGGREAVGSLALDAVSRLGLPPVPFINLNSCTRLRQQTSHHRDRHRDRTFSLRRNRRLQTLSRYF